MCLSFVIPLIEIPKRMKSMKSYHQLVVCTTIALALIVVTMGCSKRDFVGTRPDTEGEILTVSQAVQGQFLNKKVVVRGDVLHVCQDEGCWMVVTDGRSSMRISFESEAFTVPISLVGRVIVEGELKLEFLTEQEARAVMTSVGIDSDSVSAIQGNQRFPIFTATGVVFLGDS